MASFLKVFGNKGQKETEEEPKEGEEEQEGKGELEGDMEEELEGGMEEEEAIPDHWWRRNTRYWRAELTKVSTDQKTSEKPWGDQIKTSREYERELTNKTGQPLAPRPKGVLPKGEVEMENGFLTR